MIKALYIPAAAVILGSLVSTGLYQDDIKTGKEIYQKRCLTCHQADGSGVPGMFPPLLGTDKVLGNADSLIRIVIYGLKGPSEVKNVTYYQTMPPLNYLPDNEVAAVLNYVRTSWGNKAKAITVENVAKVRAAGK